MTKRTSFSKECRIDLGKQVIVDDFESSVYKFYKKNSDISQPLMIDFLNSTYIDIPVLMNFISLFIARKKEKCETYIGVSKEKNVRDFLRIWRFPEAFQEATGIKFENILVLEDHQYRGEPQTTYRGIGSSIDALEYNSDWNPGYPSRRNFFEFNTYILSDRENQFVVPRAIPRVEGAHWNGQLIKEVLNNHLPGKNPKDDVARVVIYESLSNAVRHPNANIIQSVSRFERITKKTTDKQSYKKNSSMNVYPNADDVSIKKSPSKIGYLRICVWDDGQSIVETLKPIIKEGKPIRSLWLPAYMYDKIYVKIRQFGGTFRPYVIVDQQVDPKPESDDSIILLASFHPGVSRAVSTWVEDVESFENKGKPYISSDKAIEEKAGMGLYALMRTVLDVYRGTIIVRSGNHLMLLEAAHDAYRVKFGVRYKSAITEFPADHFRFQGNLLIIQIPIRK